jgi:hypothetical protein
MAGSTSSARLMTIGAPLDKRETRLRGDREARYRFNFNTSRSRFDEIEFGAMSSQ